MEKNFAKTPIFAREGAQNGPKMRFFKIMKNQFIERFWFFNKVTVAYKLKVDLYFFLGGGGILFWGF